MDFAIELRNGGLCLYFLKNGRKIGDVNFTWEQAEWLYKQIGKRNPDIIAGNFAPKSKYSQRCGDWKKGGAL